MAHVFNIYTKKGERDSEAQVGSRQVVRMGAFEKQKADQIYAKFKGKLEAEHFGKIVAIDTDLGEIVGIGGTVLDAYDKAKEKTSKTRLAFRRVGYPHYFYILQFEKCWGG